MPILFTYILSFPFFVLFPLGIIFLLRIIKTHPVGPVPQETGQSRGLLAAQIVISLKNLRYCLSDAVGEYVRSWLKQIFSGMGFLVGWFIILPVLFFLLLLFTIFLIPFASVLFLVSFVFTSVFGIVTTIRPGASHVSSFYASVTKSDRWSRMAVFALFGVTFGGIHFEYPTRSQQTLWRSTSLAITVIPLIVALIDFLLATRLQNRDISTCQRFEHRALLLDLDLAMTILLFIYVPARLSFIAQAFALLRNQPPTALIAVDWTNYIPHLFS